MKPRYSVTVCTALLLVAGARLSAGDQYKLETDTYVFRNSDFQTVTVAGDSGANEKRPRFIRSPATIRFDRETLSLEGSHFAWNGGRNPPDRFSLIATPAVQLRPGQPASLLFSAPVQYLEKLPDGTLQVRNINRDAPGAPHCLFVFTLGAPDVASQDLRLACDLGIATITSREKVPGVELDVGRPVLTQSGEQLELALRPDEWSALLMQAPNGSDYSLLMLFKAVPGGHAPGAIIGAEPAGRPMTAAELPAFVSTYYRQPRPELIPAAIHALESSRFLPGREAFFVGFFAEVFSQNPGRMAEWRKLITRKDWNTRTCLLKALKSSHAGGIRGLDGAPEPSSYMCWGAFLASGNPAYLRILVERLPLIDQDPNEPGSRFWVGAAAMWTLSSLAAVQPNVRATLQTARKETDPRTRQIIDELLAKAPVAIRAEIMKLAKSGPFSPGISVNGVPGGGERQFYSPVGPP
jgi:hypothetical protein